MATVCTVHPPGQTEATLSAKTCPRSAGTRFPPVTRFQGEAPLHYMGDILGYKGKEAGQARESVRSPPSLHTLGGVLALLQAGVKTLSPVMRSQLPCGSVTAMEGHGLCLLCRHDFPASAVSLQASERMLGFVALMWVCPHRSPLCWTWQQSHQRALAWTVTPCDPELLLCFKLLPT